MNDLIVETKNYKENIAKLISDISNEIDQKSMYDSLSNQDILDFHYNENIYQFSPFEVSLHFETQLIFEDELSLLVRLSRKNQSFIIGEISGTDCILAKNMQKAGLSPEIKIHGGRYKKVVLKEDGSDSIKSFRKPYEFRLSFQDKKQAVKNTEKKIEYSDYALKMMKERNTKYHCKTCGAHLNGERYCPNCGIKITYPGEIDNMQVLQSNKIYQFGNSLSNAGNSMKKTGNSMTSAGCGLTLLVTVPVIIILILLFL